MSKGHLTLKIFFLLVFNDVVDTFAQLFIKKGLTATGISSVNFGNLTEFIFHSASSSLVWLGLLIFVLNFFVWIIILARVDLSIAMPAGSTCYVFVPIAAMLFLHEHVGPLRWVGIALIVLGIHFVAQSKKSPPEAS